jgi:HEAT repeat protein
VDPLIRKLDDGVANVRAEAIRSLRRIGDERALDALKRYAMDPERAFDEQKEALAAVLALTEDDVAALVELARSPDPQFRRHVIRGIGAMGDRSAVPELRSLLRRERDWRVRRELRTAIAQVAARSRAAEN